MCFPPLWLGHSESRDCTKFFWLNMRSKIRTTASDKLSNTSAVLDELFDLFGLRKLGWSSSPSCDDITVADR